VRDHTRVSDHGCAAPGTRGSYFEDGDRAAGSSASWRPGVRAEPALCERGHFPVMEVLDEARTVSSAKSRVACRSWGQILGTHHEGRTLSSEAKKGHLLAFRKPSDGLEPSTPPTINFRTVAVRTDDSGPLVLRVMRAQMKPRCRRRLSGLASPWRSRWPEAATPGSGWDI
jgi:hypothetical protein